MNNVLAALALAFAMSGCRLPPAGTPGAKVIDCSTDAVRNNWPRAIGSVNSCLVDVDATKCLISLINPVAGVTEDLVVCLTRDQGMKFAESSIINPDDKRAEEAARNARQFLAGYTFKN